MPVLNADVWGMIFSFLVEGRGPRCAEVDKAAFAAGIEAVHAPLWEMTTPRHDDPDFDDSESDLSDLD